MGNSPGSQPGHGIATGLIVAEDLGEENGQRGQGRVDAVFGFTHLLLRDLGDDLGRDDLGEEKHRIEDQRVEKAPELSDRLRSGTLRHDKPSLRDRGG